MSALTRLMRELFGGDANPHIHPEPVEYDIGLHVPKVGHRKKKRLRKISHESRRRNRGR